MNLKYIVDGKQVSKAKAREIAATRKVPVDYVRRTYRNMKGQVVPGTYRGKKRLTTHHIQYDVYLSGNRFAKKSQWEAKKTLRTRLMDGKSKLGEVQGFRTDIKALSRRLRAPVRIRKKALLKPVRKSLTRVVFEPRESAPVRRRPTVDRGDIYPDVPEDEGDEEPLDEFEEDDQIEWMDNFEDDPDFRGLDYLDDIEQFMDDEEEWYEET